MITPAKMCWLLQKTENNCLADMIAAQKKGELLLEKPISLYRQKNPYKSAAELLKLSSHHSMGTGKTRFHTAFMLAAYRLYDADIKILVTRSEVKHLEEIVQQSDIAVIAGWLQKRSVSVYSRRKMGISPVVPLVFKLPGTIHFSRDAGVPQLELNPGESHLLLVDQEPDSALIETPEGSTQPFWIYPRPRLFEDLSLTLNKRLFSLMRTPVQSIEKFDTLMTHIGLSNSGGTKAGSLAPGLKFLFYLALTLSVKQGHCRIIIKPLLSSSQERSFWYLVGRIIQKGLSCLIIGSDASLIHHAHTVSIIRDGCFLGSLSTKEKMDGADFVWVQCRFFEQSSAKQLPGHLLKTTPASGHIWLSTGINKYKSYYYQEHIRNTYGIALNPESILLPTMEERYVKYLKDRHVVIPEGV